MGLEMRALYNSKLYKDSRLQDLPKLKSLNEKVCFPHFSQTLGSPDTTKFGKEEKEKIFLDRGYTVEHLKKAILETNENKQGKGMRKTNKYFVCQSHGLSQWLFAYASHHRHSAGRIFQY